LAGRDLTPGATIEIPSGEVETLSAEITATPTSGKPPLTVQFAGWVTGGQQTVDWDWDFGDGTGEQGNEPNPVHVYMDEGTYTVTVTVTTLSDSTMLTRRDMILVSQSLSASRSALLGVLAAVLALFGMFLIHRHSLPRRGAVR
jgi:PKD repeat protein